MSTVTYSALCDSDRELYLAYLYTVCHYGSADVVSGRCDGSAVGARRDCCRDNDAVSAFLDVAVRRVTGRTSFMADRACDTGYVHPESVIDSSFDRPGGGSVELGGISGGDVTGGVGSVCGDHGDDGVSRPVVSALDDAAVDGGSVGRRTGQETVKGRWHDKNVAKRLRRRERQAVPEWRRKPVSGVDQSSSCPSYGQAMSDAEHEAKETLARRRAAENKLKEKLALMKIASLEDEKKCQEYADLKRHRVIQWTNEAVAKSQQSLDKCKSVDPDSSASRYEIRKQAKDLADLRFDYDQLVKNVQFEYGDVSKVLPEKLVCTESLERHQLEGEMYGEIESHADIYD